MDCPEKDCAQVGDTIEITHKKTLGFGQQFIVVPNPRLNLFRYETGDAWVSFFGVDEPCLLPLGVYKIIKRARVEQTEGVDNFLRKQMHDNLGSIFG